MFKDGAVVKQFIRQMNSNNRQDHKGRVTFRSGKRYSAAGTRRQAEYGDG